MVSVNHVHERLSGCGSRSQTNCDVYSAFEGWKDQSRSFSSRGFSRVQEIYKLSGAQAIAAMAYGTESVPKTLKIVGPGSAWVVAAKTLVKNDVGIGVEADRVKGW